MAQDGFGQLLGALIRERREAAGMTQRDLAEESFPDQADHEGKERRIRELELGEVTRPQARNYTPICETLNIDRATIRALKARAADKRAQNDSEFDEVIEDRGSVEAALSDASLLNRAELERLAERFGIDTPEARPDAALAQLLSLKAEEYRALKAEVEAIGETYQRLSNLKAAARGAIARGDLDEVEELAGPGAGGRAGRGPRRPPSCGRKTLCCAAMWTRPIACSLRRPRALPLSIRWSPRGGATAIARRSFGMGCAMAVTGCNGPIEMIRPAIAALEGTEEEVLWASCTQNLGVALQEQGRRTQGEAGAQLLAEAVAAYRGALRVTTEVAHPVDWARTMQNLGLALRNQGSRTAGEAGTQLLAEAVAAYRGALRVRTEVAHPVDWAMTMQNLGIALATQGSRTAGEAGALLLAEAVAAYRGALRVRTEVAHPVEWARTMQNLGNALGEQGERRPNATGLELLEDAIDAYAQSLRVCTEDAHPVDWAMTQKNIAMTEIQRAQHEATADPRLHLEAALGHVNNALRVYDPEHMSYDYGTAIELRDGIQAALDAL